MVDVERLGILPSAVYLPRNSALAAGPTVAAVAGMPPAGPCHTSAQAFLTDPAACWSRTSSTACSWGVETPPERRARPKPPLISSTNQRSGIGVLWRRP